ncbi:phenylacetate--CoA ligase family protein [Rubripirellula amarantea]|uniref:phenylacetate--CoA ligase family protein n=1 Tax=Rubripirellula amarantea TaxID=2527999 RepID=UPI0011B72A8A|nr:phenylacetate--CoA ligase family protein [Rubripirellula amarantea]
MGNIPTKDEGAINRDGLSLFDCLTQFPLTTKDDVETNFPDRITDGSDSSDWRLMSTRGTAQRLITVQGFAKRDAVRAAQLRSLRLSGGYQPGMPMVEIPPEICDVVCGDEGERDEGVLSQAWEMFRNRRLLDAKSVRELRGLVERHWILNRKMYPGFGRFGSHPPNHVLDEYVKRLRRDRPYVLKALATYLVAIAKHIRDNNVQPLSIPVIKTMGSRVTPSQRAVLEQSFGGTYWDDYGSAEFGSIACECDQHDGLHVFDDLFFVEVVDAEGKRMPDGKLGWIVVTDLVNTTMPLIRYKIGDVGTMTAETCQCGRTAPRIKVKGRAFDTIVDGQSRWRTTDDIVDFLEDFPGVDSGQLTAIGNQRYELTVVEDPKQTLDQPKLCDEFSSWIGQDAKIELRVASTLQPESGGKFRYVRGDLDQQRAEQIVSSGFSPP